MNKDEIWYYEYSITYWSSSDCKYENRSGIITADSLVNAIEILYDFYGDNIENVVTLRALTGDILEFDQEFETDTGKIKITKITDL